jgi:hypothetical protein
MLFKYFHHSSNLKLKYYFLFSLFSISMPIWGQEIEGIISPKTSKHIIGEEFQVKANQKLRIELWSKDSSFKAVIFDSTLSLRAPL